jgi:large subunit ribosomal protein L17
MRHRVAHRKLGRVTEHRLSMLRNQAQALLRHERIQTTVPKAKELRMFVEKIISTAKDGLASDADGKALHARRLVARDIQDREVVRKLFTDLAPRFASRAGGYTRLLRVGFRRGDSAEMAQVELVGSEFNPKAAAEKKASSAPKGRSKGMGGRLRAAAERLRARRGGEKGEKGDEEAPEKPENEAEESEE